MILRLCANDYHHYCYIDDGFQGRNHFVKGLLHSVQPIALEMRLYTGKTGVCGLFWIQLILARWHRLK